MSWSAKAANNETELPLEALISSFHSDSLEMSLETQHDSSPDILVSYSYPRTYSDS